MRAPRPTYPSFTLVLTQQSYPVCLPGYSVSRFRSHPRSKTCRMPDLEDPLMRTIDTRYDSLMANDLLPGTRDNDSDTLVTLEGVISPKVDGRRARRLSLSTLVIDLALAVRRSLEKLNVVNKDDDLEFARFAQ